MKKKTVFTGAATALVTPMKDDKIDYDSLGALIDNQIEAGIDAIVICGTTGETSTLSDAERRGCISYAVEHTGGRVPVIAGTGTNNTAYSISLSRFACEIGADALLTVTPYYNKATPEGLVRSFSAIADASTIPVIVYNVPARTGCNITMPVYRALATHENICGVKEASGDVAISGRILAELGDALDVYSGCDELTVPIMSLGGKGVISVVSNVVPSRMVQLCHACAYGDFVLGAALQHELSPLIDAMFCELNPIPVKTALGMLGICKDEMRLPLCEISESGRRTVTDALHRCGILKAH